MKHVVITDLTEDNSAKKVVEAELAEGRKVYLTQAEYSQEELDEFNAEKDKWIVRCSGSHYFLADSDSGEDARGYYCGYFDLTPEKAVFENGHFAGFYLCTDGMNYSGRGRFNFSIDEWGYPGSDMFKYIPYSAKTHVFLFAEEETHRWGDWGLLVRDPQKEYKSYLDF